MAFECVHCGTSIEDERQKIPRSGGLCPNCKKDPTEGWSPYLPEVAEEAKKVAEEMSMRMMVHGWDIQEAALWFLEDLILEKRSQLSIRLAGKPDATFRCGVCGTTVEPGHGFRVEIANNWRSTFIRTGLCDRHGSEGLWGNDIDAHANHPDPYLTRGDWNYPESTRNEWDPTR